MYAWWSSLQHSCVSYPLCELSLCPFVIARFIHTSRTYTHICCFMLHLSAETNMSLWVKKCVISAEQHQDFLPIVNRKLQHPLTSLTFALSHYPYPNLCPLKPSLQPPFLPLAVYLLTILLSLPLCDHTQTYYTLCSESYSLSRNYM